MPDALERAYEEHLVWMARETCSFFTYHYLGDDGYIASGVRGLRKPRERTGPTLADALCALLRDLGVEVPERPSPEAIEEARRQLFVEDDEGGTGTWLHLPAYRDLAARNPILAKSILAAEA